MTSAGQELVSWSSPAGRAEACGTAGGLSLGSPGPQTGQFPQLSLSDRLCLLGWRPRVTTVLNGPALDLASALSAPSFSDFMYSHGSKDHSRAGQTYIGMVLLLQ